MNEPLPNYGTDTPREWKAIDFWLRGTVVRADVLKGIGIRLTYSTGRTLDLMPLGWESDGIMVQP